ncbi:MAG TPA: cation diffusion facilitator family transporter [Casimicrobiaceae bacterium]|nr:cation diffusion facilitator family transporter [Casimicrobiaceae bacterium]
MAENVAAWKASLASPMHSHSHSHDPGPRPAGRERRVLAGALALTAIFAIVEAVGGWWSGSLALLSDAGHMVTDVAALSIALIAQRLAQRPPSGRASYGYARAEVLAAFTNALLMIAAVIWIAIEAVRRLLSPGPVAGGAVIVVALAGLAVNLICAWMLSSGRGLNSRAALLHVLSDLAASFAALLAGVVITATGWLPIDPLLSLLVAALILRSTWRLLRSSVEVLMEGVPAHLSYDEIGRALTRLPGVSAVHDLHVWHMTSERAALSAHLVIRDPGDWPATLEAAQQLLSERFGIDHVTLQPAWRRGAPGKRIIPVTPVSADKPRLH